MRRESQHEVTAVARRRLELLHQELAGLDPEDGREPAPVPVVGPVVLAGPGRHCDRTSVAATSRLADRVQQRLPDWLQGRLVLGAGHVTVLAAIGAAALAVTAWFALRSAPEPVPVPVAQVSVAKAQPATSQVVPGTPKTSSGVVVVDVAGKVRRPGVATLRAGSRVIDAVRRAGGARRGVDLSSLNLARTLVDGEQILVGVAPVPGIAAGTAPGGAGGSLLQLNAASLEQLDGLPGVGPVTAQKILDWRTEHGAFTSIDELLEVDGIGAKTLADIAPHVTL